MKGSDIREEGLYEWRRPIGDFLLMKVERHDGVLYAQLDGSDLPWEPVVRMSGDWFNMDHGTSIQERLAGIPVDSIDQASAFISGGWLSTSNRYHMIARMLPGYSAGDLIRPEKINTIAGQIMAERWEAWVPQMLRTCPELTESLTLPQDVFRAFKILGGPCA